jgi:hypothetical protein
MFKRIFTLILALVVTSILTAGLASTAQAAGINGQGNGNGGQAGYRQPSGTPPAYTPGAALPTAAPGELTQAEMDGLLFMREEEKLAHDVYASLYQSWNLPVFNNISKSEQSHFDALGVLIQRYRLTDPASSAAGVFTNTQLQALYNDLISQGERSLADALKVGAAIEEIDILDLQTRLSQTQRADIQQVYSNLEQGSRNHLAAFIRTLETQTGEEYSPQHLSSDEYAEIVSSPTGQGRGYRGGKERSVHAGRP